MTDIRWGNIADKPKRVVCKFQEVTKVWGEAHHGMDLGCRTTVSAIPAIRRYKVNNKSAYNSNPELSRIISIRAAVNFEIESHAEAKSF